MIPIFLKVLLGLTAISTGLVAGLFYAYSCSVSPGLKRLTDTAYIQAMQCINRAILNPVFFASFMGSLVLLPLSTWMLYRYAVPAGGWFLLAASIVYLAGVFGVTVAGNVPLNNALDKVDTATAAAASLAQQRALFERRWNRLNMVRTVFAIVTLALVIVACL